VNRLDADSPEPLATTDGPSIFVTTYFGIKPSLRPPASLVGVLDGDGMVRRPDLRASENAFHTLVELAGWAGPASSGGRLVIQSTEPNHHVLQALARADHGFFLERELALREELGYPPFGELVRLTATGPSASAVIEEAVRTLRKAGERVLGPVSADDGKEALVKTADGGAVARRLRLMLPSVPRGTRLRVDVDPR
jgi:primosomal protein N' (replication factor Y)